jgi:ATP-binding cassette subfamily C protein LapB
MTETAGKPNNDAEKKTSAKGKPFSLASLSTLKSNLLDLACASLFLNVLGLALPMSLLQVYDRILPNSSIGTLVFLMAAVAGALTLESILNVCRSHLTGWIGAKFEHKASCAALERLLDSRIDAFERDGAGAHVERVASISSVREFYAGQAMLTLLDLPFAVLYLGLVALMGGQLVIVPLALLVAFAVAAMFVGTKTREALAKRSEADDRRFNFVIEVLSGIHSVKAFSLETQMTRRYERLQEACAQGAYQVSLRGANAMGISSFFSQATTICVALAGAVFVLDGDMTTGGLAACSMLAGRAMNPLQKALGVWTRFQSFILAKERLKALFEIETESVPGLPAIKDVKGGIALRDVSFRYGEKLPFILENVSMEARPGECVVISAGNGAGKTTLLALLQGAIKPETGELLVNGEPASRFDPQSLRSKIAYLPQAGELFQGTILQNLTMFRKKFDDVAQDVAGALGLDEIVATMALGYDTPVGDGAHDSLPRGIRQRIAIARALVDDPDVILFDEANTAVDTAGDAYIRTWLERAKGRKTLVLVTSRPSLAKLADRSYVLEGGTLREKPKKNDEGERAP